MLVSTFLGDMNINLENMQSLQAQLSSGHRISKPSDDPLAAARTMQLSSDLDMNKQYATNINSCSQWLEQTDTALNQAGDVIQRVKELLTSAGDGTYDQSARKSILNEINQRVQQFSDIINSSFGGKYLFGGIRADEKPLSTVESASGNRYLTYSNEEIDIPVGSSGDTNVNGGGNITVQLATGSALTLNVTGNISDAVSTINHDIASSSSLNGKLSAASYVKGNKTYIKITSLSPDDISIVSNGIAGLSSLKFVGQDKINMISSKLKVEISQGVVTDYNVGAQELMNYTAVSSSGVTRNYDLRDVFKDIVSDLSTSSGVYNLTTKDIDAIKGALDNILKVRSEVGAKENRMTSALSNNNDNDYNMTNVLSHTYDIDLTETVMNYSMLQTVYLSSLQTSSKIIQPTLMDYM
jgi:flagellar hook-associated protein 3 FlgL